ncbi:MAG: HEAT repeat domain-containing protein [Thermodesulfobacteriota bacterium]|nr:HEAT repeat domain-containing protein [Thermodesulfobacteriota bacterium]
MSLLSVETRLTLRENLGNHPLLKNITKIATYMITHRIPFTARALFLGMLAAQVIASIQVYLSNISLYTNITAIKDAGYLAIPNPHILNTLPGFGSAFFGGIFFTLSIGTGLSLYSIAMMWIWTRLVSRNEYVLILFLLPLAACVVSVNLHGFCPLVTSYFVVIPAVIFFSTKKWITDPPEHGVWLKEILHFAPLVFLTALWTFQMQGSLFVDIRDNLLLSNSFGRRINDFYYKYTLYPAEAFKSLQQKMLKTCSLDEIGKQPVEGLLRDALINDDYLDVGAHRKVDLNIRTDADLLVLETRGKIILKTSLEDFLSDKGKTLKRFSVTSDRHGFFRKVTLLSLLIGFPIFLYVLVFSLFCFIFSFIPGLQNASRYASILCFITGIGLLIPFYQMGGKEVTVKNVAQALQSENRQERVEALKIIHNQKKEIGNYRAYQSILKSAYVPEIYWLVKALGVSRKPETYADLLTFVEHPHPNVVCMALYALGRRGDKRAVKMILKMIERSDHWYCQWYAYKALRSLGWKQKKLK